MTRIYKTIWITLALLAGQMLGCDNPVSYSPFEADLPTELHGTTGKNLQKIMALNQEKSDSFRVALISDPHYHFNKLIEVIDLINTRDDIAFIIVGGDLTENGLQKEFELFHSMMERSKKPYLTVIGNHDYLSNGAVIYRAMYGPVNYSFEFNNTKFVMWDNVLWESNKEPDWEWFREALSGRDEPAPHHYDHIIPVSHIPPIDGQLASRAGEFNELLLAHNITKSIHGHKHTYESHFLFDGTIDYVTIGSPQHRTFAVMTVTSSAIKVQQIKY